MTRTANTIREVFEYEIGPNVIWLIALNCMVLSELILSCPVTGVFDAVICTAFPRPVKLLQVATCPEPLLVILVGFDASNQTLRPEIFVGKNVVV